MKAYSFLSEIMYFIRDLILLPMQSQLWQVRITSFGYSLLSMIIVAIIGVIASPAFATLITANFGNTAWVSLALLFIPEVVKALRNWSVVKNQTYGSSNENGSFLI